MSDPGSLCIFEVKLDFSIEESMSISGFCLGLQSAFKDLRVSVISQKHKENNNTVQKKIIKILQRFNNLV